MQHSNIETLDFEARWAELMMPVEEDNDTDPATVCPRDLEEQTRPVKDDLAFQPCTMYAATTVAPPQQLCMQRLAATKLILRMPLVPRRLSDNQKDMVLNYGSKYPQLVGEIITSSAFANKDVKELEEKLGLKQGILFKWRRCLNVGPTEHSYDPLARWTAMAPLLRTARGAKSVEHLELLRINDPTYGSLAPRKELPAKHELPYEPLARWTAMAPLLRTARGAKSVEHLELLRINDPTYGSLAPRKELPAKHELPYDPLARWTAMAPLLRTARGAKSVEHLELLRVNDPTYGSLAPRKELPAKHELPYDPLARWTAMAPLLRMARGAKSVEHLELLRINDPTYGSLAPRKELPAKHELPYEPLARWTAMAPLLRTARGAKSVEHLELLRINDPTYGSLAPRKELPAKHELPYDPLARWTAMAPLLRTARGAKSVEHLELLRVNDPTYGSLAPRKELPAKHELPYDPLARWTAMAPLLRTARGAKSVEHLELLRVNDPTYGSLAPRSHAFSSAMRIDAWIARMGWLNLYHAGAEEVNEDDSGSIEADDEAEADTSTSSNNSDEAQRPLSPVPANSPVEMMRRRLPRILSGNVLDALADDIELLSDLSAPPTPKRPETAWKPPAATLNPLYASLADKRSRRASSDSDAQDDASERSAARTTDGRHSGERVSTDTISSYLDETGDPRSSGEWSNRSEELSAFTAAGHLTEPTKSTKRAVPSAKVKAPWGDKAAPGGELPKDLTKHAAARRQGPFAAGLALLKGEPKADWTA